MNRKHSIALVAVFLLTGGVCSYAAARYFDFCRSVEASVPKPVVREAKIFLPPEMVLTMTKRVTAYTSNPKETDDTPFITASQEIVRDGIVGTNQLGYGTKVKIPALFGDKIFVVEDRMNLRYKNSIDIWMGVGEEATKKANEFGYKYAEVVVLLD